MSTIEEVVSHLNSGQTTVITADQPVHALGKQVNWMYEERYTNVLWLMGPLHIEMACLSAIGDWLEGPGWVEAFEKAHMTTTGRIESFLTGKKGQKNEVWAPAVSCCLSKLAKSAFENQVEF